MFFSNPFDSKNESKYPFCMKIKSSRRFAGVFSMTASKTSFRVHTKIGPDEGEEGNSSSLLRITSPSTPISNNACPTRPPPIIIAGSTLILDAMIVVVVVVVVFLVVFVLLLENVENAVCLVSTREVFFDDDNEEANALVEEEY